LKPGWDALRRGDAEAARSVFARLTAARPTDANAWYGLAMASRGLGEIEAHLNALDKSLSLVPDHLPALLMKADHYAAIGDDRAAQAFYGAAVSRAPPLEQLPTEFRDAVRRAERESARYAGLFESRLRASLSAEGYRPGASSRRIDQALDLLLGRKQVFLQSPTALYFPELPQRQFFEREEFDWVADLESKAPDIREELLEVLRDERGVEPYVRSDGARPPRNLGELADNPSWSAFYLIKGGAVVEEHAARCPRTMAALAEVPLSRAPGRTPSVLFSLLRPRSRIGAHNGQLNTRLICHLPLIVPDGCALRVGNETRPWIEERTLIFDDSIEHEAWNDSDRLRVILLFEVWRPELTAEERRLVSAMLASVGQLDQG
jgi:aspartyl/asparaginyl beta-hydroxylase (cupin superfamily)